MRRKMVYLVVLIGISALCVSCSNDDKDSPKTCECKTVIHYTGTGSQYVDDITSTATVKIDKGSCSDANLTSTSTSMGLTATSTTTCYEK